MAHVVTKSGDYRHSIRIQNNVPSRDAHGQVTWSTQIGVDAWASFEPLEGREFERAKAVAADATHMVKMRYRSDVTRKSRIVFNGRTFEIVHVQDVQERQIQMRLLCKEAK